MTQLETLPARAYDPALFVCDDPPEVPLSAMQSDAGRLLLRQDAALWHCKCRLNLAGGVVAGVEPLPACVARDAEPAAWIELRGASAPIAASGG